MFCHESEATARKVKAQATPKSRASRAKACIPGSNGSPKSAVKARTPVGTDHPVDLSSDSFSILPNLSPTIDERAVGFFYKSHVLGFGSPSRGVIEHLQEYPGYDLGDNLMTSIKAVGLVGFANELKAPHLLVEAKKQYLVAVRHLNAALQSPTEMKKDSTLFAVMILGIFETLAGREENSLIAWAAHLNGAAALMKVRGPGQVSTLAGRRLFGQITASLATSCLQQEKELPDHILDISLELNKYVDATDVTWRSHRILLLFTNFFGKLRRGKITNLQETLDTCLNFDNMITQIFADMPSIWQFSTVYSSDDPEVVYLGYYHVYYHPLSAMMSNGMRSIRIMLNEIIRNVLIKGFSLRPPLFVESAYSMQLQTSTDTLYRVTSDIIASVPQHLGYSSRNDNGHSSNGLFEAAEPIQDKIRKPSDQEYDCMFRDLPTNSASASIPLLRTALYQLPWALYLVGVTDIVTEPILLWVIKTLRRIGQTRGIQQAAVLAARLESTRLPLVAGGNRE